MCTTNTAVRDPVADYEPIPGMRIIGHGSRRIAFSHGWIADSTLFDPVLEFVDHDIYTLLLIDHRGYGARRDERSGFDLETSTTELLSVAQSLGWETFTVVGHSMGALVAQMIAVDYPSRLESMVLVAPVPASGAPLTEPARYERMRRVRDPSQRAELIRVNAASDGDLSTTIAALSAATTTISALAGFLDSFGTVDFGSRIVGCTVPTLIVLGEDDPAVPAATIDHTLCTWLPQAHVVALPTGHYPMQQQPAQLWKSFQTFWATTPV